MSCFVRYEDGDDTYDIKAKGERYFSDKHNPKLEGKFVVSWDYSLLEEGDA